MNEELEFTLDDYEDTEDTVEVNDPNSPYADIEARFKAGEELSDQDIDTIADIALGIIREILSFFDAEDSNIDEYEGDNGELIFDVINPELAVLIGRHGKTLDAIQVLVSTLVNKKLNFRYPVVVDIESYKNRRKQKLESLAFSAAKKAQTTKRVVKLHPMSAYERRLIHLALRNNKNIQTYSEGDEPERRIVIAPK